MTQADSSLGAALCNTSQGCVYHPEMSGEDVLCCTGSAQTAERKNALCSDE